MLVAFLCGSGPARAEETSVALKGARAGTFVLAGISLVSFTAAGVFLAQSNSAYEGRLDIARANGTAQDRIWDCTNADECARMSGLRADQARARDRFFAAAAIGGASLVSSAAFLVLWLMEAKSESAARTSSAPRVVPSVGSGNAGIQLVGAF